MLKESVIMRKFYIVLFFVFFGFFLYSEVEYQVEDIHFKYDLEGDRYPNLSELKNIVPQDKTLSHEEINNLAKKVISFFHKKGITGISVRVDPQQIDEKGKDLRTKKQKELTFIITPTKISDVHTVAIGSRIKESESRNHEFHQNIKDAFRITGDDLIYKNSIDNFISRLNRHRAHFVQAQLTPDEENNALYLEYIIKEKIELYKLNIKEKTELNKLNKSIRKTQWLYDKDIKQARKEKKPREEIEELVAARYGECQLDEYEIEVIKSRQLTRKAYKLNLPLPSWSDSEYWTQTYYGGYILTQNGKHKVTKLIRQEWKERIEVPVQFITVLIGLGGVIIAILALLFD